MSRAKVEQSNRVTVVVGDGNVVGAVPDGRTVVVGDGTGRRMMYADKGIVATDTGAEVVVRIGGATYAKLQRAAEALSRTFDGDPPSNPADVFVEVGIAPEVVGEDFDLGRGVYDTLWAENAGKEVLAELDAELVKAGLVEKSARQGD